MSQPALTVFAFSADWGLPSTGPFALKLIAWLTLAGFDFDLKYEDDTRKGPKGKNPWIEIDGVPMGDSELIIQRLSRLSDASLETGLTQEEVARGVAIRRMVEEHLHQVFEYEFIVMDAGYKKFREVVARGVPGFVEPLLSAYLRRHFRIQLTARGIARHTAADIADMGKADVDALDALLGDRDWFVSDRPTLTDCSVFGLLAPVVCSGIDTPVCTHARSKPRLVAWVQKVQARVDRREAASETDTPKLRAV